MGNFCFDGSYSNDTAGDYLLGFLANGSMAAALAMSKPMRSATASSVTYGPRLISRMTGNSTPG